VGLTTLPFKEKIVEKLPRNSAGFCGGGQSLSWIGEPREEELIQMQCLYLNTVFEFIVVVFIIVSFSPASVLCAVMF
jgi:hypothetical protein